VASLPRFFFVKNAQEIINETEKESYYQNFNYLDTMPITDKSEAKKYRVNSTAYCVYETDGQKIVQQLKNADIYLQGTSTLEYPVRNYLITNYSETSTGSLERFAPGPRQEWYPDSSFTLKCDYMDESHKNNTPTAKYYDKVRDCLITKTERLAPPLQIEESPYRDTIDGFACLVYVSDTFNGVLAPGASQENILSFITSLEEESNFKGTYMFNFDKAGIGLGLSNISDNDGNTLHCISYEGGSNIDYSASTFYPLKYANEHNAADEADFDNLKDYYDHTMEPRNKKISELVKNKTKITVINDDNNEEEIPRYYLPLYRAIKWLN
jgi:hypothetical protein